MRLVFLNGPKAGSKWELLSPGVRIGRETDNDIQLLLGGVSRYHARITKEGNNSWCIRDLGSTNGTKIDGALITGIARLNNGNIILIGDQEIRVEEDEKVPSSGEKKNTEKIFSSVKSNGGESSSLPPPSSSGGQAPAISPPSRTAGKETEKKKKSAGKVKIQENKEPVFQNPDTALLENIFNDAPSSSSSGKEEDKSAASGNKKKSVVSSILFYVILVSVAVVCVALFLALNQETIKKTPEQKEKKDPNKFFLAYEKEEMTRSSIFRFEMLLECRLLKITDNKDGEKNTMREEVAMVSCSVVEQKAEDKVAYKFVLPPTAVDLKSVEKLRKRIQETDFMKLVADSGDIAPENNGKDQMSCITVGYNGAYNSITVRNTSPKLSYNTVEELIEDFTEEALGVRTVSMSVEEVHREAAKHYERATEYFENYEAKPENLRFAIKRFQLTSQLLERFNPRPKIWYDANSSLQKAEKILAKIKKDLFNDLKIKMNLQEYPEALVKAKLLLDYLEPDTESYWNIRKVKINIERNLAKNKGRRKK